MNNRQKTRRHYRSRNRHRGVTMVESSCVLMVCLLLLLGMMDMSVAVLRYNIMSAAARRLVRSASVHGASAPASMGKWGPASVTITAANNHPAADAIRDMLTTMDPDEVAIEIQWPEGTNEPDDRVRATIRYRHDALIGIPGWYSRLDLESTSTMRIAH